METTMKGKTIYHIFTDHKDWYKENKKDAYSIYNYLIKQDKNARLYEITFTGDTENDEHENCLESFGNFPA